MNRLALALSLILPVAAGAQTYPDATAIVSVGGPVTETVFALGQGDRVVARDTTSTYPDKALSLPNVGYMRRLSAEGVLSVSPDLILTRGTAGPPEAMDQLRAASIPIVEVTDDFTPQGVIATVRQIGAALGVPDRAETLADDLTAAFNTLPQAPEHPARVLFVLSNQAGRLNVAGAGTGADGIITLAGAQNVMASEFSGYRILNDEALIAAAPDVVLMMTGQEDHEARAEEIFALPAMSQTPAAQNGAFVTIDGAALGFGPRTAAFAHELADAIANVTPHGH
ncbi:MAG: ABC transporter substrate-binding protein [Pseudomonadota bacterium]|jgi:iron complex transport system substrate-binding protein|nr:ABC transporter substrate-binding protein [Pseudomonadota bacterium]MEC8794799.1 ABC transporter substrate-binding protein [Pseudomonadota bacterium]